MDIVDILCGMEMCLEHLLFQNSGHKRLHDFAGGAIIALCCQAVSVVMIAN